MIFWFSADFEARVQIRNNREKWKYSMNRTLTNGIPYDCDFLFIYHSFSRVNSLESCQKLPRRSTFRKSCYLATIPCLMIWITLCESLRTLVTTSTRLKHMGEKIISFLCLASLGTTSGSNPGTLWLSNQSVSSLCYWIEFISWLIKSLKTSEFVALVDQIDDYPLL